MRYRLFYKAFGKRSRQVDAIEIEDEMPHEVFNDILLVNPLAVLVGVFVL